MANKESSNLSIVVVNFNGGEYLIKCLDSLKSECEKTSLDVWVVDNVSTDGYIVKAQQKFPEFNFILNQENLGFSKANNIALRKIQNENILILNPDTEVLPGVLNHMLQFMESHEDVGAATCRVELANGSLDWGCHRGFPTPWASLLYYLFKNDSLYHLRNQDISTTHEVDSITGAFLLTRKSVLDKVGLFDEDYFMYAEDIDLCFRIKKAGFKVMFVPDVKIIHYKGVASGIKSHSQMITTATVASRLKAFNSFYETMKIFYKKNLAKSYPFFINWLVLLAIDLKWLLAKRKLHV